ncbi:hypothetical protein [Carp edema virus]|nr:hypothetical protein [Carp edema virus]
MELNVPHDPDFLKSLLSTILERSGTRQNHILAKGLYELIHPILAEDKTRNYLGQGAVNLIKTSGSSTLDTPSFRTISEPEGGSKIQKTFFDTNETSNFRPADTNEILFTNIDLDPKNMETFKEELVKNPNIIFSFNEKREEVSGGQKEKSSDFKIRPIIPFNFFLINGSS